MWPTLALKRRLDGRVSRRVRSQVIARPSRDKQRAMKTSIEHIRAKFTELEARSADLRIAKRELERLDATIHPIRRDPVRTAEILHRSAWPIMSSSRRLSALLPAHGNMTVAHSFQFEAIAQSGFLLVLGLPLLPGGKVAVLLHPLVFKLLSKGVPLLLLPVPAFFGEG